MQPNSLSDRRGRSRLEIGCHIKYRIAGTNEFYAGALGNLAEEGALIWMDHELDVGTTILFLVDSVDPEEAPTELAATVVRVHPEQNEDWMFGYGCNINEAKEAD